MANGDAVRTDGTLSYPNSPKLNPAGQGAARGGPTDGLLSYPRSNLAPRVETHVRVEKVLLSYPTMDKRPAGQAEGGPGMVELTPEQKARYSSEGIENVPDAVDQYSAEGLEILDALEFGNFDKARSMALDSLRTLGADQREVDLANRLIDQAVESEDPAWFDWLNKMTLWLVEQRRAAAGA